MLIYVYVLRKVEIETSVHIELGKLIILTLLCLYESVLVNSNLCQLTPHLGLTVGFLLLLHSFVYTVESLSLFNLIFISEFVLTRR